MQLVFNELKLAVFFIEIVCHCKMPVYGHNNIIILINLIRKLECYGTGGNTSLHIYSNNSIYFNYDDL